MKKEVLFCDICGNTNVSNKPLKLKEKELYFFRKIKIFSAAEDKVIDLCDTCKDKVSTALSLANEVFPEYISAAASENIKKISENNNKKIPLMLPEKKLEVPIKQSKKGKFTGRTYSSFCTLCGKEKTKKTKNLCEECEKKKEGIKQEPKLLKDNKANGMDVIKFFHSCTEKNKGCKSVYQCKTCAVFLEPNKL